MAGIFAHGGTLGPPATFQSICESLGGTYVEHGQVLGFLSARPGCEWAEIADSDLVAAFDALRGFCSTEFPPTFSRTSLSSGGAVRCMEFPPM